MSFARGLQQYARRRASIHEPAIWMDGWTHADVQHILQAASHTMSTRRSGPMRETDAAERHLGSYDYVSPSIFLRPHVVLQG